MGKEKDLEDEKLKMFLARIVSHVEGSNQDFTKLIDDINRQLTELNNIIFKNGLSLRIHDLEEAEERRRHQMKKVWGVIIGIGGMISGIIGALIIEWLKGKFF